MEPILTIDNLNSFGGNMLRQGDKSQLKYRLRDVGNKNLSISGKPCEIKMYGCNYTTVVYETTATVSSDNTVTFTIDKVLPKGTFYLEFTVGDYIFPTDHKEFFEITPSGKGMEANIIEIVGVDAVVAKVLGQVQVDIDGVLSDIDQSEADRVQAEQQRQAGYAEVKQIIEDGAVPADNSVTRSKIASESVEGSHIKRDRNLFNPYGQINSGMRLNDGTISPRNDVGYQRIWLNPKSTYYLSTFSDPAGVQFDSNGQRVGVVTGQLFTTTEETAFVDFNVNLTGDVRSVDNFMVVETNQAIDTYKPYNQPFIGWLEDYINGVGIDGSRIKSNTVDYESFKKKINLFDKNKVQSGYVTSDGTISPHQSLGYSHQIPLEPNRQYSIPLVSSSAGALYDNEGNIVEYLDYNLGKTFATPSEVSYGIFNVNTQDSANILYFENYMVVPGNEYPQEYIRYGETIEWLNNYLDRNKSSKWENKKIDIFGTSITWYSGKPFGTAHSEAGQIAYGHASAIESELGAIVSNHGISGGTFVEQIQNKVLSLDFKDTDAVILGGGVNDWYYGEPLGLVEPIGSNFDGSTTTGALQIMVEHILNSNPKVTLFLISPLRAWFKDEYVGDLSGKMLPEAYAEMYRDVSALYGLPFLDLYNSSGVNDLNKDEYFGDIGALGDRLIHPNNDLYRRLNSIILPFIERY